MTIPLSDGTPAGVLDVTSHYFEFIPEEEMESPQPTVFAAHELREGRNYYILPTTAFGLYRYDIRDVVRVAGFHNQTPLIEFLSKGAYFSSVTGEKLSEYHVTQSMARALRDLDLTLTSYSLAPCWDDEQPYYGLFMERGDLADAEAGGRLAERLDALLKECNIEYGVQARQPAAGCGAAGVAGCGRHGANGIATGSNERAEPWSSTNIPCLIADPAFHGQIAKKAVRSGGPA